MKLADDVNTLHEAKDSAKERADAIAFFFASWDEKKLKELLAVIKGEKKPSKGMKVGDIIKDITSKSTGNVAFGLNDVKAGIEKQLKKK